MTIVKEPSVVEIFLLHEYMFRNQISKQRVICPLALESITPEPEKGESKTLYA